MFGSAKLIIISGLLMSGVGAFWYVSGLQADLQTAQENTRTLERSVNEQQQVITQMREDQEQIAESRDRLEQIVNTQRNELDSLRSTFNTSANGSDRDFGEIALSKPGLVENLINKGTVAAIRCMELASGAELTQEEQDAIDNGEPANEACPSVTPSSVPE